MIKKLLIQKKEFIDSSLEKLFHSHFKNNPELLKMIQYAFFPKGKRLRPILAITMNEILGGKTENIINSACALELFHVATLLLDDLPCMDDDDYRRGKLSFHKKFSEHDAINVAFGLCKKAFEILSTEAIKNNLDSQTSLNLIKQAAIQMGFQGVIGGQQLDLTVQKNPNIAIKDPEKFVFMTANKTINLFTLSTIVGTSFVDSNKKNKEALIKYAENFGLAFQIMNDLSTPEETNPLTFYKLYGEKKSLKILNEKVNTAIKQIEIFGNKSYFLKKLALEIIYITEKTKSIWFDQKIY